MKNDFTVLIITSVWWSAITRAALEFLESAVTVHALCPPGHSLRCLKGIRTFQNYPYLSTTAVLSDAIVRIRPDLIIPADDRAVGALHQVYREADPKTPAGTLCRDIITRSLGQSDYFAYTQTRLRLIDMLRARDIPTPAAINLNDVNDLKRWCASTPGPWVLKRDRSWGGSGVVIADTLQEAENGFRRLSQPVRMACALRVLLADRDIYSFMEATTRQSMPVIAQAYIPGKPANIMVACWEGKVIGMLGVDVVSYQGRTGAATVIEITQSADMERAAQVTCATLNLSGFFGLDFVRCAKTGTYHFIEMNPRLTQIGHLYHGGTTLIHRLLHHICGSRQPACTPAMEAEGRRMIALFPQILRADASTLRHGAAWIDIPWRHPELVEELLRRPWPRRGSVARLEERLRPNMPYGKSVDRGEALGKLSALLQGGMVTDMPPMAAL
ncbi:ATP-grasp domain-containing protein [Komagataeibacter medellinensis]|uniref:ATP-grasp domain-containing protein n=1 Tax=Komagataeibacter medellinensis TaxID=1177712 RepID=A0ABQ6VTS4_9PROT|nr:ATP-grasp domain-containing protein [Komagataeibacter medellinensis]KAB8123599.1 ATP-grasp domain-containing protein [Komagataeibacter medellinensis]